MDKNVTIPPLQPLSNSLSEETISDLKTEIAKGTFPGIDFEHALRFLVSGGIIPVSGLPLASFIKLENWIRAGRKKKVATYTVTELKNNTGRIVEQVLSGATVLLSKHGRPFAELKKIES